MPEDQVRHPSVWDRAFASTGLHPAYNKDAQAWMKEAEPKAFVISVLYTNWGYEVYATCQHNDTFLNWTISEGIVTRNASALRVYAVRIVRECSQVKRIGSCLGMTTNQPGYRVARIKPESAQAFLAHHQEANNAQHDFAAY